MPTVTRELSVTYAGVTLGGTDDNFLLFDRHEVRGGYETIGFTGLVLVRADTAANFATKCAALETAFQTPNGTLVITQSSQTLKSFGHSGSTGFLGRPSYRKMGGREDTGRSRLYEVRVDAQRPADLSGKSGLRIANIAVRTTFFNARSYRVAGTYTAISSTSASAKYAASVGSFLSSLETDLTGTWIRLDKSVEYDDENKVAHFTQEAYESGLRDATYAIQTTQTGLRSYRVAGTYTDDGTNGAQATYAAAIGSLLTTFETALTGTWLRGANSTSRDQADKLVRFEYNAIETGLRDAVYEVRTLATGQREYRVTGQYEKVGGTGAESTYTSAIAAVLSTLEAGLTGTWEREESLYRKDQTDTIVTFEWRGVELIYAQADGGTDHASLKNTKIRIQRASIAPGDTNGSTVTRPVRLLAMVETDVPKSVTQDLKTLWEGTVRPYLISKSKSAANASAAALLEERPEFDFTGNRITGSILIETYVGSALLAQEIETEDDTKTGVTLIPVWSGDPDEYEEYQVQREKIRTITTRTITLGVSANPNASAPALGGQSIITTTSEKTPIKDDGYVLLRTIERRKDMTLGLSGNQVDITMTTRIDVYQFRKKRNGGSGTGSDGRIATGSGLGQGLVFRDAP